MPELFFTEVKAISFSVSCDVERMQDAHFSQNMELLVEMIRVIEEDGRRVFAGVSNSVGLIDLRLRREAPLRVIQMWANRIEKMMQELQLGRPAA